MFAIIIILVIFLIIGVATASLGDRPITLGTAHSKEVEIAQQYINSIKHSVDLVNSTMEPKVFFSEHKKMLKHLKDFSRLEGDVKLSGKLPSVALNEFISKKEQTFSDFIFRYYSSMQNRTRIANSQPEKAKIVEEFYNSLMLYKEDMTPSSLGLIDELKNEMLSSIAYKELPHYEWLDFEEEIDETEHFRNLEHIQESYSKVTKNKNYFGKDADDVIYYAERDIAVAEEFMDIHKKYNQEPPFQYGSFKTLALLYEHRKEYEKAISVCKKAIDAGWGNDGTKGAMAARLKRLEKRYEAEKANQNVGM